MRQWLRHGAWNTLDHLLIRVADGLTSLLLLWWLAPEFFAQLALAQAWVAPLLVLFVCPEITLYRDLAAWKQAGRESVRLRLEAIRWFGWMKLAAAVVLAWIVSLSAGASLPAMIWAFAWALGPQISGADREFLRLELRLTDLAALTIYQKATFIGGAWVAVQAGSDPSWALAGTAVFSVGTAALLAAWRAARVRRALPSGNGEAFPGRRKVLIQSMRDFSAWYHVNGILMLWVFTMDLWVLGLFASGEANRELGLYAIALKVCNFAMALPWALSNLFSVWIGRRRATVAGLNEERSNLVKICGFVAAASLLQWAVWEAIAPWALPWLARGRWTPDELQAVRGWMHWMLAAGVVVNLALPWHQWLTLRAPIRAMLLWVGVPWAAWGLVAYSSAVAIGGADAAARANGLVAAGFVLLLALFAKRHATNGGRP